MAGLKVLSSYHLPMGEMKRGSFRSPFLLRRKAWYSVTHDVSYSNTAVSPKDTDLYPTPREKRSGGRGVDHSHTS